jgi:Family of unknown function (DUF5681)
MANTKNLKPFPKGKSGNPGGRPRRTPLTDAYLEQLEQPYPRDRAGRTYAEVIAQGLARKAARGDVRAAQEMADRTEGRVGIAVPCTELSPARGLGLTIAQWDRIRDGGSLLDDYAYESEKSE